MNPAIVIIPTTGAPELEFAIQSVLDQTQPTDVLVIFDGAHFARPLNLPPDSRVHTLTLPFNTGASRTKRLPPSQGTHWFGHRVLCAAGFLVNNDYAMFLDQDNWLRADHVASCIEKLESRANDPYQMVFALRNIHRKNGTFICRDDCHSLGLYRGSLGVPLIDTSCYFFRTDFLLDTAHFWLSGWGGDRRFLQRIIERHGIGCFAGTGRYTVRYRLGGNASSPTERLFTEGNALTEKAYRAPLRPWAIE